MILYLLLDICCFLQIFSNSSIGVDNLWNVSLASVKGNLTLVLFCISPGLILPNVFSYIHWPFLYFLLWRYIHHLFAASVIHVNLFSYWVVFSLLSCKIYFYIIQKNRLSDVHIISIFSGSAPLLYFLNDHILIIIDNILIIKLMKYN